MSPADTSFHLQPADRDALRDDLRAKVREVMVPEGNYSAVFDVCHGEPRGSTGCVRELDLLDWGLTCGVAFAIARLREPDVDEEVIAQRAYDAAHAFSVGQSTPGAVFAPRPSFSELVDRVLLAHEHRSSDVSDADLSDALAALSDGLGVPSEGPA
jgi:hypothetical protein